MRPEILACARRYVPGEGPIAIEPIAVGEVNETFRVERAGRWYALRVGRPGAAELGIDRGFECRLLAAAARAGLAPTLAQCEPERRILVLEWQNGRRWSPAEARMPANLARIGALVRRVQSLSVPQPVERHVAAWIAHYGRLRVGLEQHPQVSEHRAALERVLEALAQLPAPPPLLCHGDLHCDNLIETAHGLTLVDWEYAHLTDPLWDLAAWASGLDLDAPGVLQLLQSWGGRPPEALELERFELLRWLYEYLCLLWSVITAAPDQAGADPLAALSARLRRGVSGRSART